MTFSTAHRIAHARRQIGEPTGCFASRTLWYHHMLSQYRVLRSTYPNMVLLLWATSVARRQCATTRTQSQYRTWRSGCVGRYLARVLASMYYEAQ
eukprot:2524377-Rhodomonas_salina.1